jgi:hypothetical protein
MINERSPEVVRLAQKVADGSIVAQATERLIYQIVEVCAEHEKETLAALRAQNAELVAALKEARNVVEEAAYLPSPDGGWKDWCDETFAAICDALGDCPDHNDAAGQPQGSGT